MRRFVVALAALAAASCSSHEPADQDAAAVREAEIAASQGSTPEVPKLESELYCARFAAGAGTPDIEKSCNEQEAAARSEVMAMTVPAITRSYCASSAEAAGGSYQVYKLCVEKEEKTPTPQ